MSKSNGFLQLRRGLWEHVRDGSLTHTGALVYIYMLTQADTRSGIWRGSAQCLASALNIPKSTAKYALRGLDRKYIRRFTVPGRHVCYPILLHKFLVTQGQYVGLMLDALNSTDERTLEFFKPDEGQQVVEQVVQHVAPQRIREKRNEERKKAAAPPADPRFTPFSDFAYNSYEVKHGRKPLWGGKDWSRLKSLLKTHSEVVLSLDGLKTRWENYSDSTEPFWQKQGDSLATFCSNIDRFVDGPQLATPGKGTNGKPTATDLALQNARALGLGGRLN